MCRKPRGNVKIACVRKSCRSTRKSLPTTWRPGTLKRQAQNKRQKMRTRHCLWVALAMKRLKSNCVGNWNVMETL
ncbi:hypothetical protein B5M09_008197 [Aphanomyces astaci]|uniref:Uncharacterized protein n=1 Tax=Aphanomyces astaci TaxID=112090 RepID=A0A3R7Y5V2_APHAT|nr:hypothetical protein B5M09_008197 [Aphanomyces astaci]